MKVGNANRAIGVTDMNSQSSRSRSCFILTLQMNNTIDFSQKTGKLYLVDLAGSEKIAKTGAQGMTLKEAQNIN
jgi:kinesin family protein 5